MTFKEEQRLEWQQSCLDIRSVRKIRKLPRRTNWSTNSRPCCESERANASMRGSRVEEQGGSELQSFAKTPRRVMVDARGQSRMSKKVGFSKRENGL